MSTEKTYRIPAVHRLLAAAAPFLMCVIMVFLFESTETASVIVRKTRQTIPSTVGAQVSGIEMGRVKSEVTSPRVICSDLAKKWRVGVMLKTVCITSIGTIMMFQSKNRTAMIRWS